MIVMPSAKTFQWMVNGFLAVIVAIVFQQVYTSMTEQGIASGGPYNNGASYPRAIAIAIAVLVVCQIFVDRFSTEPEQKMDNGIEASDLRRPMLLLIVFAVYLGLLKTLGYHLTTTPLVLGIMLICGARNIPKLLFSALTMSFAFAYIFENFLNVVLPGGIFSLNIPW
jgi:putative tricarboxylic transport membrane protein